MILNSMFVRGRGSRIWRSIKSGHGGQMRMSTMGQASSSPWMMLPPGRDIRSGDIIHNFYSLAEKKHRSFDGGFALEDGTRFVGSSHGWLALFNARNNHLFLTNPLSSRRIELPAVDKLPDPEINLRNGRASVSKVILSCSPTDGEWRALMAFGPGNRLAFCSARRPDAWTPIGRPFMNYPQPYKKFARNYEDFVYYPLEKSFICSPYDNPFSHCTEYWFVGDDADDPPVTTVHRHEWCDEIPEEFATELGSCFYIPHLVLVEQLNQLFYVVRFVKQDYPHKTVRFAVFKVYDDEQQRSVFKVYDDEQRLKWLRPDEGDSLDGLAMFVGINHSLAVTAADFANIKPNSIYFTHCNWNFTSPDSVDGCGDVGIFDFQTLTVSPCCCHPSQLETSSVHPPLWFTPSPH